MNETNFLQDLLINVAICIVPVGAYLKFKSKVDVLDYLKLKGNATYGIIMGLIVSMIFCILLLAKNIIVGFGEINFNLGIFWVNGLLVGFIEEIPFRGFLMQKLSDHIKFWKANICTTIVFVAMHMPIWIALSKPLLRTSILVSCSSIALGYLFKKYNSLWTPIICHSVYDLCFFIGL